ncbi:TonB-dependent receptor [Zhongshania aliphaticivorans]|uniref:TonB-dependent receptor n=1 Tax=Zhongshania aliphaticivorans TaxID=1470434 RepID=UPI0012E6AAC4|nr:TonB-dependent receptor [Zhongshania aliphaticivorans]CAA0092347.1 Ferric aerobactin receptor [Zhongshania aliphaticivorans]
MSNFKQSLSLTTLALIAASGSATAKEFTEEMVVTASRSERPLSTIANTVTVINEQELIKQMGVTSDMSTILGNLIPSFAPSRQKMTSAGESLRGRKPLYLVDGVPQSNPLRDGGRDAHTIDPLMLERVEVIHGANAIHGLGASGGIINLITKRPSDTTEQSIRIESFFQEEDFGESLGYGVNYSASGSWDNFDGLASIGYRESGIGYDANGDIIGFDNAQGDTLDSEMANVFLKLGYNWADQRLEMTVNHYDISGNNDWVGVDGDIDAGVPTTAEKGNVQGEPVSNEVTLLSFNYTNENFLGHKLRAHVFTQEFAATYGGSVAATFQDPAIGASVFDQSQNNSEKQGIKITLIKDEVAGLPVNLVYGMDIFTDTTYQKLITTGRYWVPKTEYENYAPFLQVEYVGVQDLTLTAGVRQENSELAVGDFTTLASYNGGQFVKGGNPEFDDTLFNIGATYKITDTWRLFGNASEGFSMADVGRVLRGINTANQSVETFLDLEPIITDNTEIGAEYTNRNFQVQLSYYQSDSDFGQRLEANADGIYTVKREKTEISGIEFRSTWFASEVDTLNLRVARQEGEYDSDADGKVDTDMAGANIGPNRINLSWDREWTDKLNSRLQLSHVQDRNFKNSSGQTTTKFKGYTTIDTNIDYAASFGTLSLGVQNLSNEDYFTYYSQTTGSDARNFKGIGRSVSVSFAKQF